MTNPEFAHFVAATGHVTFAEMAQDPRDYPGMPPELTVPGSPVFAPARGPVDFSLPNWWRSGPRHGLAHAARRRQLGRGARRRRMRATYSPEKFVPYFG